MGSQISGGDVDVGIKFKGFVAKTAQSAKRANIWRRYHRGGKKFIELVSKMCVSFRSRILLGAVFKTLEELLLLLDKQFKHYCLGYETAQKISLAAHHKWRVKDALNWLKDPSFPICWGMLLRGGTY